MDASTPGVTRPAEATEAQAVTRALQGARLRSFAGAISVVGGLVLWELISRVLVANPLFLAAPSQIMQAVYALTLSGEMARHMAISAIEFALGYAIASVIWLGIGIWSKVLVVILLVLFPVTINTDAGLRNTSERLLEMLRSFGATPRQI